MLKDGIFIGSIFGISIRLHYSWFLIFGVVTWALSTSYYPDTQPTWSTATSVVASVITSLLFFVSLLAHELMHSVVAQRAGIPVKAITLFVFGGVSQITQEPQEAKVEFRIALAGPLTSIVLGIISWAIWYFLPPRFEVVSAIAFWLGWINLMLAVFNLLPGFPLDGGRVLRAIIWWRTKNLRRATRLASNIGRGVGLLLVAGGAWFLFGGFWFNGLWLALIGWFLFNSATQSYRQLILQQTLQGYSASDAMHQDCSIIDPDITIEGLVNDRLLPQGKRCFLVTEKDQVRGLLTLRDIKNVLRGEWPTTRVEQVMQPIDKLAWVNPDEDLNTVLGIMTEKDINQIPVMEDGQILGMIARDNLLNFINVRSSLGIGDESTEK